MSGSATFTTVMSRSSMKIATETAISVHHFRSTRHLLSRPRLAHQGLVRLLATARAGRFPEVPNALEWTRTITGRKAHKALNHSRR